MIEVENLTKEYRDRKRGAILAADSVSFHCGPGEIVGILGPNGAGKTTTLRMISTAIPPSSGSARVMGLDVVKDATEVRKRIGFLSASTGLYGRLTPRETLRYFGNLFGMAHSAIADRTEQLAGLFGMNDFLDRPCDKLSTGMKQKVNIARTVLHDPPVMVFDEPTSGLDVLTGRTIVGFIRSCRDGGKTVLFSTHIMSEVEKLCDRVAIIHRGRIYFQGTVAELRETAGGDLEDAFVRMIGEAGE